MPAAKPAPQCQLILPSEKRCGGIALRGQPYCYHHSGNHRKHTRERQICQRLEHLGDELNAMDASELLIFLYRKLARMQKTFDRFPEEGFVLAYAIERVNEITSLESAIRQLLPQDQQFVGHGQPISGQSSYLPGTSLESNI
jgi:hypothetical protein